MDRKDQAGAAAGDVSSALQIKPLPLILYDKHHVDYMMLDEHPVIGAEFKEGRQAMLDRSVSFSARKLDPDQYWIIEATRPNGTTEQLLGVFSSKFYADRWIADYSQYWLAAELQRLGG